MFQQVVGEIGRDRREYLYDMSYCEILLIARGYHQRNILQYQLQRMNVWASMFCMGNPDNKVPEDIFPLYFDDWYENEYVPLTDEEHNELQSLIRDVNNRE